MTVMVDIPSRRILMSLAQMLIARVWRVPNPPLCHCRYRDQYTLQLRATLPAVYALWSVVPSQVSNRGGSSLVAKLQPHTLIGRGRLQGNGCVCTRPQHCSRTVSATNNVLKTVWVSQSLVMHPQSFMLRVVAFQLHWDTSELFTGIMDHMWSSRHTKYAGHPSQASWSGPPHVSTMNAGPLMAAQCSMCKNAMSPTSQTRQMGPGPCKITALKAMQTTS
mmetsp:Transcript_86022/g.238296  ORF Transcript_86022/g.238296 Transcript_86022/m.238296 type:complete len:220 (+) Transcript_86022:190-849(+)